MQAMSERYDTRIYTGARWCDPAVGRWTSAVKWLGNVYRPLSLNRYLYGEDDPVNLVDPSGRFAAALGAVVVVPGAGQIIAVGAIAVGATIAVICLANDWDKLRDRLAPEDRAKLEPPMGRPGTQTPREPPFKPQPPTPPKPPWWWYLLNLWRVIKPILDEWHITYCPVWECDGASHRMAS